MFPKIKGQNCVQGLKINNEFERKTYIHSYQFNECDYQHSLYGVTDKDKITVLKKCHQKT